MDGNVYDFIVKNASGEKGPLRVYRGKVLLIVNTASKCGFTPQYAGLQRLYEKYKDSGFVVLAFPCNQFASQEPGDDESIQTFCELNYGVTFPVFAKTAVNGEDADPLFKFLKSAKPGFLTKSVKWNFTKFLIDRAGKPVARYSPMTSPKKLEGAIRKLLASEPAP
ncbi:MAG: glutathione peroxidase [Kiritimatiellaeota bacterium]|nr:glutathione peroxidase [Kiritimatiellota bacterium]